MKAVFFDIDTQIDFLYPSGALYVPGGEKLVPRIAELNRYAASHGIAVVSDMDAHSENDPEFATWPAHCVSGTVGQQKPASTILDKRALIPDRPTEFHINGAQQIIVEKVHLDVFTNPNVPELLAQLAADKYVVYGVVTEYCVKWALDGLLATGKQVALVCDAVETLNRADSDRTLAEFTARGGQIVTLAGVLSGH